MRSQEMVGIPFPVIVEFQQGIAKIRQSHPDKALHLEAWFEWLVLSNYVYPEMTRDVAILLGRMHACRPLKNLWLVCKGQKEAMSKQDLCIAAISIVHGMPIATIDTSDFLQIHRHFHLPGLFNPITGTWSVNPAAKNADSKIVHVSEASAH